MSDDRPRPQYGELAPPGWSWKPPSEPAEEPAAESVAEVPPPPAAADPAAAESAAAESAAAAARTPLQRRDLLYTIALLVLGVVFAAQGLPGLLSLRQTINDYYALEGLGSYGGGDAADIAGVTGAILHVVILLTAIGVSASLISRRRLSFYVPMIGGALALIVSVVCVIVAIAADPTFVSQYSGS